MPPRTQRPRLRAILLPLCCALIALLPASATHAQIPAPSQAPASPATPAAKAAAPASSAAATPPAPVKVPAAPAASAKDAITQAPGKPATPLAAPAKPATPPASAKIAPVAKAPAPAPQANPPAPATRPASIPSPTTPSQAVAQAAAKPATTASPAPQSSSKPAASPAPSSTKTAAPAPAPAKARPAAKTPVVATALTPADEVRRTFKDKITPFIKTYCFECHGDRRMKGGVNFAPALKNPSDPAHTRRWKLGLATVNAHDMPPDDADKQPTDAEREEFMTWVRRLKYLSPQDPGAFVIRRLTKTEYGNTLHDLLGVSPDIVKDLPDEVPGEGYLNTLSPLQMEQYLGIANAAIDQALAGAKPGSASVPLAPATQITAAAKSASSAKPEGTKMPPPPPQPAAAVLPVASVPLKPSPPSSSPPAPLLQLLRATTPPPAAEGRTAARGIAQKIARHAYRRPATVQEVDVLLRVFDLATQNQLPFDDALRLMLKAALVSPQFLYITPASITSSSSWNSSSNSTPGQGTPPPASPTPPPAPEILPLDDWMLASRLSYLLWATMPDEELSTLADQGKLHDPAILSAQVQRLLRDDRSRALFDGFGAQWLGLADLADKTFDTTKFPQMTPALRQAMYDEARLFFTSIIRENLPVTTFITADYTYLNGDLAALYNLGAKNTASAPTQSSSSSSSDSSSLNSGTANSATQSAPHSLAKNSVVTTPPTATTTPPLQNSTPPPPPADAITGSALRRVKLTDPNRGGILGMPGILATTSFPNRTSPVKRGVWVLEQILGEHIPPAPPNVPTLEKQDKKKIANLTLRQRTELHRTNIVCANCHKILDPIGFGLENFDAIGRWRDQDDTGGPIDAAGELPGGKHFSTPAQLKAILALRKDDLTRTLTEKLLAYALCRQLEGYDEIIIDQLMSGIAKDGHRMQPLITSIITSYPFLNRRVVDVLSVPGKGTTGKK